MTYKKGRTVSYLMLMSLDVNVSVSYWMLMSLQNFSCILLPIEYEWASGCRRSFSFEGSTVNVALVFTIILRLMALNIGEKQMDSEGTLLHSDSKTHNTCNIELA